MDPQTTVSAGLSAGSPQEAVGQASATAGFANATKIAQGLRQQSWAHQRVLWSDYSTEEQAQLKAVGYSEAPTPTALHSASPVSSLFGDIVGGLHDVGHGIGIATRDTLGALSSGLHAVQHVYRAGQYLESSQFEQAHPGSPGVNADQHPGQAIQQIGQNISNLFSASGWSRSWRATTNGEKTFDPTQERVIQNKTDPLDFQLAKQLASGVPEQEIVNSYHPNQRQQIQQAIISAPVKQAANELNYAHISIGRNLLNTAQIDVNKHPELAKVISGSVDAAFDVAGDPTMQAGKFTDALKLAKWGVSGAMAAKIASGDTSAYRQLLQNPQVQRWVGYVGGKLQDEGWSALERTQPQIFKVASLAAKDGVNDAPSLNKWLQGNVGMNSILEGNAATLSHNAAIMPHLSVFGYQRMLAKGAFTDAVDYLNDTHLALKAEKLGTKDIETGGVAQSTALDSMKALPENVREIAHPDSNPFMDKLGGPLGNLLLKPATSMARVYKQMTTLTADKPMLNLGADDAPVNLKRMLSYALPSAHVNKLVDAFVASDSIGQKFNIVKGATAQMLHAAGVYAGPGGAEIGDKLMQAVDDAFRNETYSPLGIDKMADYNRNLTDKFGNPLAQRSAVLDGQISDTVALPSFKELRIAARKNHFLYGLGIATPGALDGFMNAWKAMVLMRVGFAVRVSMDEWLGNGLRNGFVPMMAAAAARSEFKRGAARDAAEAEGAKAAVSLGEDSARVGHMASSVAARVPSAIVKAIKTPRDMASAVFGHAVWAAYGRTPGALTKPQYMEAAGHFFDHVWSGGLGDMVSSLKHAGGGYDENTELRNVGIGDGKAITLKLKPGKGFGDSEAASSDPGYKMKWHYALGHLSRSQLARPVLDNIDAAHDIQVDKVLNVLKSPEFEDTAKRFSRYYADPEGRLVSTGEITRDDALKSWAHKVVAHTNALVRSGDPKDGEVLHDVVNELRDGKGSPSMDTLDAVGNDKLPKSVYGPELAGDPTNFSKMIQSGFQNLSKIIDWISRQPIALQAYAESREDLRPWVDKVVGKNAADDVKESMLSDLAWRRAGNRIKPYIHSPEIRSQFEVIHRTAMPFLFAQDQFLKRWIRTFADSPEGIRKAQLAMNGLRTSGFVHTDANGNEYFYYPGSATVTSLLSHTLTFAGIPSSLPIAVPFTAQVKNLLPGLNDPITPGVGPVVAIPLKELANFFPELQPAQQAILQQGASQSWWEQVLPSTATRLIQTFTGSASDQGEFGSMMMKAMQQAEETGHGLPINATPQQAQAYLDRMRNWTRVNFFVKAALGFTVPATPTPQFDPKNFNGKLQTLLNEMPYDQAITTFLKENPTASPYTVFLSSTTGDVANLPSTTAAGDFINSNRAFVAAHPQASGWFIPRTTGNNAFDPSVYREQITYGMRDTKLPSQFLQDIQMAPSAQLYYTSINNEQAAIKNAGTNTAAKSQIRAGFDQWEAQFARQNPAFADYLAGGGKAVERAQTITDLQHSLNDPTLPQSAQTDHIRMMVQSYDSYESAFLTTQGNYSSSSLAYQARLKAGITDWANTYIAENPDVADLWNVLLLPELGTKGVTQGLVP